MPMKTPVLLTDAEAAIFTCSTVCGALGVVAAGAGPADTPLAAVGAAAGGAGALAGTAAAQPPSASRPAASARPRRATVPRQEATSTRHQPFRGVLPPPRVSGSNDVDRGPAVHRPRAGL